jgi:predicted TIM-barrel fold metal-dependent hydrolase
VKRRLFLGLTCGSAFQRVGWGATEIPIIDTHIHLFDTTRPQGVPWPDKNDPVLYQPALPDRYRQIAVPLGVRGAIEVEASPWLEDNQWVLDVAAKDSIIVGTVGNLEPGKPEFGRNLERFHRNPLFRGIRYGNLWGRSLAKEIEKSEFRSDLKLLSQAGLTLDSANPNPELIAAMVRLTDAVPELRVVIDHLPQMQMPADPEITRKYQADLRELHKRPQVYVKLSEVFRRIDGHVPRDLSVYRDTLDEIYGTFGEDRVLYGSDWPNSDRWRPYADVLNLVKEYFADKGPVAAGKYFWRNSVRAYRWVKRDAAQPEA